MKMTKNRIQSDILERGLPEEVIMFLLKDRSTGVISIVERRRHEDTT